jgi:hypothetical protein
VEVLIYTLILFLIPFIYQYKIALFFYMKSNSLLAAVFLTSLVNLILYSGCLIGWTYYSFYADIGWDIETLILSGAVFTIFVFITNLFIMIIYLYVRKKRVYPRKI